MERSWSSRRGAVRVQAASRALRHRLEASAHRVADGCAECRLGHVRLRMRLVHVLVRIRPNGPRPRHRATGHRHRRAMLLLHLMTVKMRPMTVKTRTFAASECGGGDGGEGEAMDHAWSLRRRWGSVRMVGGDGGGGGSHGPPAGACTPAHMAGACTRAHTAQWPPAMPSSHRASSSARHAASAPAAHARKSVCPQPVSAQCAAHSTHAQERERKGGLRAVVARASTRAVWFFRGEAGRTQG